MEHEQGICPACGSDGLTYGGSVKQDIALGYQFMCESCGFAGIEWYNLHFTEHTTPDCIRAKTEEIPKAPEPAKKDFFMVLSDKIVALSNSTSVSIDRLSLDITLSQAMTEQNRADMQAFMEKNEEWDNSGSWVLAQVMHDIEGFKQEYLSDEPTGFVARTFGFAEKSAHIIIFVEGGVMNSVCSTDSNITVTLADKDNVETEEDEAAYNILVALSGVDGYTEIY